MRTLFIVLVSVFTGNSTYSQFKVSGIVKNELSLPLSGAIIQIGNHETISDSKGYFLFKSVKKGDYTIQIHLDGYDELNYEISIVQDEKLEFMLSTSVLVLEESLIKHTHKREVNNIESWNREILQSQYSGSLAKSLEKIPGIQAMEIGSGSSKPIIRGLGFNRILVAENGIKQEGQQWGADHGLEINPWSIEEIKVIKGAGTLEYGGDAIGGVITVNKDTKPLPDSFSGEWISFGRSVNQSIGTSLNMQLRQQNFFYKLSGSISDFADYSIPTDQIVYLDRKIPIYNERLKNTAGNEASLSTQIGFVSNDFESILTLSNFYQKTGFFPGAHGIPTLDRVQDDGDIRNVEFPYQNVNHFKVQTENTLKFHPNTLKFIFGFQNNHRQEWSLFHTHYGENQQPPTKDPNLELDFDLTTFDAQVKYQHKINRNNKIQIGIQSQSQKNTIKGYNFLLPEFNRYNLASYVINEWELTPQLILNYGLRLDYTQIETKAFFDEYLYEFLLDNGHTEDAATSFAQRSQRLNKTYRNLNGSAGISFQSDSELDLNLNLGSNFRVPTAIELASNGIHHGSFRHERGNPNLNSEKGFSADLKAAYHPKDWYIEINPYFYYFNNYIILEPSGNFSPLPHGGQIYQYNQSKAMLTGFEFKIEKTFQQKLHSSFSIEYLYNRQIRKDKSKNYPLPFSPPMVLFTEWSYELIRNKGFLESLEVSIDLKYAAKQDRIAPNEEITDAYTLFGAGIKTALKWDSFRANIIFSASNLGNTRYFNHMSFYRAMEIPEMGRNIQLILRIPFGK